jgi:hypothetical protein
MNVVCEINFHAILLNLNFIVEERERGMFGGDQLLSNSSY